MSAAIVFAILLVYLLNATAVTLSVITTMLLINSVVVLLCVATAKATKVNYFNNHSKRILSNSG